MKAYAYMESRKNKRRFICIQMYPDTAFVVFLGIPVVIFASLFFWSRFVSEGWLLTSIKIGALVAYATMPINLAFVTWAGSRDASKFAIFRWQQFAKYLKEAVAKMGLSEKELVIGLNALRESRRAEEKLILGSIAVLGVLSELSKSLYDGQNLLVGLIRKLGLVPSAQNYHWFVIGFLTICTGYLLRYFAPAQWDKQLRVFLGGESDGKDD